MRIFEESKNLCNNFRHFRVFFEEPFKRIKESLKDSKESRNISIHRFTPYTTGAADTRNTFRRPLNCERRKQQINRHKPTDPTISHDPPGPLPLQAAHLTAQRAHSSAFSAAFSARFPPFATKPTFRCRQLQTCVFNAFHPLTVNYSRQFSKLFMSATRQIFFS